MTEILSLVVVYALGCYMLLDNDPAQWWQTKLQTWIAWLRSNIFLDQNVLWAVAVGLPAVGVALLDLLFYSPFFHFLLSLGALLLGMKLTSYMRYQAAIIRSVYANDAKLAIRLANQWEVRLDSLEDSDDRFTPRMLGLCANRLCEDIIPSLVFFVLIGPAGVVLCTINQVFFATQWVKPVKFDPIKWLADACCILLFALSGNMSKLMSLLSLRPSEAALLAGNINPENIDLELVPGYGNMLTRAMVIGFVVAVLLLLVWW